MSLGEYAASLSVVRASEDTTTPPAGGGEHDNQATCKEVKLNREPQPRVL